ncbi:MAG: 4-(cytidine 5'-diphospho)-2-C-methyl-D-erythritol kinase [Alphaproteobacteria bacterium]|nr:4-(cytidine 5'-diphospho)-2-C-methyl-D-erythritol kinase [Alphaproteobacteria bacterium]MCB9928114.1 4-(cytidine 5'-diphospho)-2-C-methyl-D-erythritol kinase [Alphaproteobacteria bacterium]
MPAAPTEPAPAKLNLYLHVLGHRPDGYHELQSLVAFADCGDRVTATGPAPDWTLDVDGPFADRLEDTSAADNLVLRAARRLQASVPAARPMALRLGKDLPVAAGIGGGSADAAATIRLLARLWGGTTGAPADWADLGADIPVCLVNRPALVEGMGERVTPVPSLPSLPAVLVNPAVPSATGAVFAALAGRFGAPAATPMPPPQADMAAFVAWLARQRNDLTRPAMEIAPAVGEVLAAIAGTPGALLARMSGSGTTCFGLFATEAAAAGAARSLRQRAPHWWIRETLLRGTDA